MQQTLATVQLCVSGMFQGTCKVRNPSLRLHSSPTTIDPPAPLGPRSTGRPHHRNPAPQGHQPGS